MARTRLTSEEITSRLAALPGWRANGDASIERDFAFADHTTALGFVVRVATVAETMDHHPSVAWTYNRVNLALSTHDAGGVTERDFQLAVRINALD